MFRIVRKDNPSIIRQIDMESVNRLIRTISIGHFRLLHNNPVYKVNIQVIMIFKNSTIRQLYVSIIWQFRTDDIYSWRICVVEGYKTDQVEFLSITNHKIGYPIIWVFRAFREANAVGFQQQAGNYLGHWFPSPPEK